MKEISQKQQHIKKLMERGLDITRMIEPLARIEGHELSISNVYRRVERMMMNKVVSAREVRTWRIMTGRKDAEQLIRRYHLE